MTVEDQQHDAHPHGDELTLVDATPPRRRGRRAAVVSGAALAAAAAAVIAVVAAPGHHSATGDSPAAAGRSTAGRTALGTAGGGAFTYVHDTYSDGYRDVWIPANPTTGTWALRIRTSDTDVSQRAACAAFPYYQLATATEKRPDGTVKVLTKGGLPGCDADTPWSPYRPPFADALPTDPQTLLAFIRTHGGGTDAEAFETGWDFVTSGWVPKDVASNVIAALTLIPGAAEKQGVSNRAGATGTALTWTGRIKPAVPETWGVIVSSAGEVIGSTYSYSGHPTEVEGITRATVDSIGATK